MKTLQTLALVLTLGLCLSSAAQAQKADKDIESIKQQQYVPPSSSPNSVNIGTPQVYYYHPAPYYHSGYSSGYYAAPAPTFEGNQNNNKPGFWNTKSPIPGQYVPPSSSPSSINIGTPTYYYGY